MSKKSQQPDGIALSYYDCLLRNSDVDLLRGPHWLNDTIIGFYFEYLNKKFFTSHQNELLFVSPEVTQLLKLSDPSDFKSILESTNESNSSYMFFPLNDCGSRESAGGTHWSLLVYSHSEMKAIHFDSSRGHNKSIASDFTRKILDCFNQRSGKMMELNVPQQDNGYDCGLYVLCFAELTAEYIVEKSQVLGCEYSGIESLVGTKRQILMDLICSLHNTPEADR